ncbi:unnamed protein product, partial [marine sediment metagenome]
ITSGNTWKGILINKKKDGSLYYESAVIFPIKAPSQDIINYAAVKRDVTNEKILEDQLLQSQKLEAVGQLAGGIAHDFNNILTAINGFAALSQMKVKKNSSIWHDLKSIQESGKRAADLIRQLLAFSRKQIIEPRIIEINVILSELEKMLKRLIGEDVKLRTIPGEKLGPIKADPSQIGQILINLVLNARDSIQSKAGTAREKKITIQTSERFLDQSFVQNHAGCNTGRHILISVSDTGSGISEDIIGKVFDPFFTTKEKGEGTGLGLSTVYGIVKQNKCNIFVESKKGEVRLLQFTGPVP